MIGKYTATPGGLELRQAIKESFTEELISIFAEVKRQWNLNNYKITESLEQIDPMHNLVPIHCAGPEEEFTNFDEDAERQARELLDELITFVKKKFRGPKKLRIAISWLQSPENQKNFKVLAAMADSSAGSVKVTLTRVKQTLARSYDLSRSGNRLVLNPLSVKTGRRASA